MKFKPIHVTFKPYEKLRNRAANQVADWYEKKGIVKIDTAEEQGFDSALAVAMHEIIEKALCDRAGITCEQVDLFDLQCHDYDPGCNPAAPYHHQHMAALKVERAVCKALGLSWKQHYANMDAVDGGEQ